MYIYLDMRLLMVLWHRPELAAGLQAGPPVALARAAALLKFSYNVTAIDRGYVASYDTSATLLDSGIVGVAISIYMGAQ